MKKALSFFAVFMLLGAFAPRVWGQTQHYDFSATAPSGQTLYYKIYYSNEVWVTYPCVSYAGLDFIYCYTDAKPTGNLVIPSTVTYNGNTYNVTHIDTITFALCTGLTSITIPNSVTSIDPGAFAFCSGLTSVTIPSGVTSIGSSAFNSCSGLTSVFIPNSVISIGSYAFSGCTGLTSVTIPGNVTSIGGSAFDGCSGLTSVTIGSGVTSIGSESFRGCSGLTSVTIPNSVDSIGAAAFKNCSGLTSVTIGSGVTSIGSESFSGCSGLTSVTIPNSVDSIGAAAFKNCSGLTSVNFNADSCKYAGYVANNSVYTPFGPTCTALTIVNVGSNVKALPDYIFAYCRNLTNVNLPNSLKYIGKYALSNTAIGGNLTVPNSVTVINESAFWRCYNLTGVTLSNSLTEIGRAAFREDTNLASSVTIPNFVTTIGSDAFWKCKGLTSVNFGSGVSTIGEFSFGRCTGLTSITIPASVTTIKGGAFYHCTSLTEIQSSNSVAPLLVNRVEDDQTYGAFDGVPSSIPVYIPCGSSNSYYSRWSYFSNFIEEEAFTFTATSANDQQGTVQILTMPTCTSPQAVVYASANSGYHFDHWSDNSTANPYSLTVTEDLNLVAYFATDGGGTEGIDDIDAAGISIYSEVGRIVVEGTTDEVNVYDMTGRSVRNDNLPAGVYTVKVGNAPAKKVMVIR